MKFYFLFLLAISCCTLLNAQASTYNNVLPALINTSGNIEVTANCKYAPNTSPMVGGKHKEDCYVGFMDNGGYQNFSYEGHGSLSIQAKLPQSTTNKDIILTLSKLSVNGGTLFLQNFHGVTTSNISLSNASLDMTLIDEKTNAASQSGYGKTPVFILIDDLYNQQPSRMMRSKLLVKNGDIILGKAYLFIDEFSSITAMKDSSTNSPGTHTTPTIKSQAHIVNHGCITATTLKNGESISIGSDRFPGIGNQSIGGTIDNYGLIVANVDNSANGTINFHSLNGKMGSITGSLTNTNGTLNIYVVGARYEQHSLVGTGSSGLDKANIIFDNNAFEFIAATMDSSKEKITITKKENNVWAFRQSLNKTQKGILDVLDSRYNIYTYGGSDFLKKVINDTQKSIYSTYLSAPFAMLDNMKPKFNQYNTKLDLKLIANGFFGSDIGIGGLGGFNINYGVVMGKYIVHYELGYGYGAVSNERKNYNADTKGHIISFGAMNHSKLPNEFETETKIYSLMGFFDSLQSIKVADSNTTSSLSKSSFNIFNLGVDTHVGYKINFGDLSIKPFMGFNQTLSIRNKLTEKGGFNAVIPSTNSYMMYLSTGVENRYLFSDRKYIYAKLGYEYKMLNTRNLTINLDGINVIFTTPFANKFMIDMGGEFLFKATSLIALGVSYNTAITQDIHYFGGNLTYKFKF